MSSSISVARLVTRASLGWRCATSSTGRSRRPTVIAEALRPEQAGITLLHQADDLTVLNVVWAPRMSIYPHDHRMWAIIGIYGGREDKPSVQV